MSNQLNPGAKEFVPNFGAASFTPAAPSTNDYNAQSYGQNQQQPYYNNSRPYNPNYNNNQQRYNNNPSNNRQYNNNNNRNYNGNSNYRGNNHRGNNHHYGNRGNTYYQNPHDSNVDAFEMEARCEAVIDILQDDKMRSLINPTYQQQDSNSPPNREDNADPFDDEEEMLEMMAMQEECRLEMMKFYIQSQNPNLFEEVYHGVSYPDAPISAEKLEAASGNSSTAAVAAPTAVQVTVENTSAEQQQTGADAATVVTQKAANNTSSSSSSSPISPTSSTNSASLKDLIANDLNTNAAEFDPSQIANLNLNEKQ